MVKNLPAMQETQVQGREWQPTPVFLPGEFHGQEKPGGKSMGLQRVGHCLILQIVFAGLIDLI